VRFTTSVVKNNPAGIPSSVLFYCCVFLRDFTSEHLCGIRLFPSVRVTKGFDWNSVFSNTTPLCDFDLSGKIKIPQGFLHQCCFPQSFPDVSLRPLSVIAPLRAIFSRQVAKTQSFVRRVTIAANVLFTNSSVRSGPLWQNTKSRRDSFISVVSRKVFLMFLCARLASLRLCEQFFHAKSRRRRVLYAELQLQRMSFSQIPLCALALCGKTQNPAGIPSSHFPKLPYFSTQIPISGIKLLK